MIRASTNRNCCAYCREDSSQAGELVQYKPGRTWILLCAGCAVSYPMTIWRRIYSAIYRWWRLRGKNLLTYGH